jgi:hypothetical protein
MNPKRNLIAALVLCAAAVPAFADVGISIGEPGFYGSIDLGGGPPPAVYNPAPVIAGPAVVGAAPLYLRVPPDHQRDWAHHCAAYNACGRPTHFVKEDWYRDHYHH